LALLHNQQAEDILLVLHTGVVVEVHKKVVEVHKKVVEVHKKAGEDTAVVVHTVAQDMLEVVQDEHGHQLVAAQGWGLLPRDLKAAHRKGLVLATHHKTMGHRLW